MPAASVVWVASVAHGWHNRGMNSLGFIWPLLAISLLTTSALAAKTDGLAAPAIEAKTAPTAKESTQKSAVTAAKAKPAKKAVKKTGKPVEKSAQQASKPLSSKLTRTTASTNANNVLLRQGIDSLKRGRAAEALQIASRIDDEAVADILRGEAYASGAGDLTEIYAFAKRRPVWPQRATILATAEGQLPLGNTYEPMLNVYSAETPPTTPNGFAVWQATLEAHGRSREAGEAQSRRENAPLSDSSDISARWKDLHMQVRDYISQRNYAQAYTIAAQHGLQAPLAGGSNAGDYSSAEFLAGWLALRYLHDAPRAMQHFQNLYKNVKTPVSRTRGAYWLGRTAEALGNPSAARDWYQEAASTPTFFYGQLALAKLEREPTLTLIPEPAVPSSVTAQWNNGGLPHAVRALSAIGDEDRTIRFMKALAQGADSRADFANAANLARELRLPYLEVLVSKAANQKNIVLGQVGFPLLSVASTGSLSGEGSEPALTLGIIRQESEFRPSVQSPAGALGLMQLMPATAKALARENNTPYADSRLVEPAYNIALGRTYLGDRVAEFGGSYILAIASYNAGKGRVREWMDVYGDPRDPNVDPIDWIETIPIYETRNYVQRVLENTEVYRVRLTSLDSTNRPRQSAPLGIIRDLTRK